MVLLSIVMKSRDHGQFFIEHREASQEQHPANLALFCFLPITKVIQLSIPYVRYHKIIYHCRGIITNNPTNLLKSEVGIQKL